VEIDERSRHELHVRLEEVLGPGPANTLMANLPPVPWSELATKHDLERGLETLKHELVATFHAELNSQTRMMFFAIVTIVLTMAGLTFGLVVSLVP
jgi:hypothetical protein